jgi:DUF3052 family protein
MSPATSNRELGKVVGEIKSPLENPARPLDFVLLFVKNKDDLKQQIPKLAARLAPTGFLWIAWPKKSSGISSDLSFNEVQSAGLALGMVDTKVCAVDETWSGLKFVIRLKDRPGQVQKMAKP